jgi:DNA-nicking Smr family endonuclease
MPKKKLSPEDIAFFQAAMKDVKRLKANKIIHLNSTKSFPKKIRTFPLKPEKDFPWTDPKSLSINSEAILQFAQQGIQYSVINRLQNEKITSKMTLDLHGFTIIQARKALGNFLEDALNKQCRYICVIHGKGKPHSMPILKNYVAHWLKQHEHVLAFCSTRPSVGGTGALNVLLRNLANN